MKRTSAQADTNRGPHPVEGPEQGEKRSESTSLLDAFTKMTQGRRGSSGPSPWQQHQQQQHQQQQQPRQTPDQSSPNQPNSLPRQRGTRRQKTGASTPALQARHLPGLIYTLMIDMACCSTDESGGVGYADDDDIIVDARNSSTPLRYPPVHQDHVQQNQHDQPQEQEQHSRQSPQNSVAATAEQEMSIQERVNLATRAHESFVETSDSAAPEPYLISPNESEVQSPFYYKTFPKQVEAEPSLDTSWVSSIPGDGNPRNQFNQKINNLPIQSGTPTSSTILSGLKCKEGDVDEDKPTDISFGTSVTLADDELDPIMPMTPCAKEISSDALLAPTKKTGLNISAISRGSSELEYEGGPQSQSMPMSPNVLMFSTLPNSVPVSPMFHGGLGVQLGMTQPVSTPNNHGTAISSPSVLVTPFDDKFANVEPTTTIMTPQRNNRHGDVNTSLTTVMTPRNLSVEMDRWDDSFMSEQGYTCEQSFTYEDERDAPDDNTSAAMSVDLSSSLSISTPNDRGSARKQVSKRRERHIRTLQHRFSPRHGSASSAASATSATASTLVSTTASTVITSSLAISPRKALRRSPRVTPPAFFSSDASGATTINSSLNSQPPSCQPRSSRIAKLQKQLKMESTKPSSISLNMEEMRRSCISPPRYAPEDELAGRHGHLSNSENTRTRGGRHPKENQRI